MKREQIEKTVLKVLNEHGISEDSGKNLSDIILELVPTITHVDGIRTGLQKAAAADSPDSEVGDQKKNIISRKEFSNLLMKYTEATKKLYKDLWYLDGTWAALSESTLQEQLRRKTIERIVVRALCEHGVIREDDLTDRDRVLAKVKEVIQGLMSASKFAAKSKEPAINRQYAITLLTAYSRELGRIYKYLMFLVEKSDDNPDAHTDTIASDATAVDKPPSRKTVPMSQAGTQALGPETVLHK